MREPCAWRNTSVKVAVGSVEAIVAAGRRAQFRVVVEDRRELGWVAYIEDRHPRENDPDMLGQFGRNHRRLIDDYDPDAFRLAFAALETHHIVALGLAQAANDLIGDIFRGIPIGLQ